MAFRSTFSPTFNCLVRAGNQGVAIGSNTLAAWVKWDNLSADYEVIEINDSGGQPFASAIHLDSATATIFYLQRDAAGSTISAFGTPVAAVWQHVALTWDGTTLRAYLNGVQVDSATGSLGARGNWADLQIGPGVGELQDACFYTVALTAEEIQQLYRNRIPGRRDGLRHHMPCFPGATNRLIDYSGNALNFSNSGTPVDATTAPQAGWGTDDIWSSFYSGDSGGTNITADGLTQVTGTADVGRSVAITAAGLTQTTGDAAVSRNVVITADGLTQCTGAALDAINFAQTAGGLTQVTGAADVGYSYAKTAAGLTQCTGSAAVSLLQDLSAGGLTRVTGAADVGMSVAITASGLTQCTGSANTLAPLTVTGVTQCFGTADVNVSQGITASGLTQCTGAAAVGGTSPITASGLTQCMGSADVGRNVAIPATGLTQCTGAASVIKELSITADGLTQTTGAATVATNFAQTAAGLTQCTGVATLGVSVAITANGLTQCFGTAAVTGGFVPPSTGNSHQAFNRRIPHVARRGIR